MTVEVKTGSLTDDEIDIVEEAIAEETDNDDFFRWGSATTVSYELSLGGGKQEDEYAAEIARAVWSKLGKYCPVEVIATYLEELPFEQYNFDEHEYEQFVESRVVAK